MTVYFCEVIWHFALFFVYFHCESELEDNTALGNFQFRGVQEAGTILEESS